MAVTSIETLCQWSAPKRVETRTGPRNLRTGHPSEAFWTAWRSSKETLKAAGVSVSKDLRSGDWQACWWLPLSNGEQAKIAETQAASRAVDAPVNIPCPDGLAYLGYQKAGIAYSLSRPSTLIADEMGLGKTIQAIGVLNSSPSILRTLVVCPASLRLNWKREIEKWTTKPLRVHIVNGGKVSDWPKLQADGSDFVVVINYDVLAKHRAKVDTIAWDLLVCDEAHLLKNPKAIRTKAVLGQKVKNEVKQQPIKAGRKLFLTGTPIVNRPIELWPLVEALDPEGLGKNFFGFAKRYTNAQQTRWGWDFSGASRLDELQRLLREKFMVRRLKADVLTELPAKRRQVIEIPANGASAAVAEEKRAYDSHRAYIEELEQRLREAEIQMAYELQDEIAMYGEIEALRGKLGAARKTAFTEMSKIRHEVALAKVPHVIEHLTESLEAGPVICFAHHRDVIAEIAKAFPGCVTLTGESTMEQRQAAVDAFQEGLANLFIGNIQAAGVGITLTRSSHVVFAELDWVPGNLSQAEDRAHRIGQTQSVLVQHVVLEDSLDAEMAKKVTAKQEVIGKALDETKVIDCGTQVTTEVDIPVDPKVVKQQEAAANITPEQIAAGHRAVQMLAGVCDGARKLDGAGFNRFDTGIGHDLAARSSLSPRQALLACKFAVKYQRQLPADLVATCKGKQ